MNRHNDGEILRLVSFVSYVLSAFGSHVQADDLSSEPGMIRARTVADRPWLADVGV